MLSDKIIENIRKIMNDRKLTQSTIAEYIGTSESQFSKIMNHKVQMSFWQLENLASKLSMREIDVITYPDIYVDTKNNTEDPVEAVLQIKLKQDKKDQVLKLIFGQNNIEILNK